MQREESVASTRFRASQFHESRDLSPTVRDGHLGAKAEIDYEIDYLRNDLWLTYKIRNANTAMQVAGRAPTSSPNG